MIKMIVATSKNNQIGVNGTLPWHISEDLKYFSQTTRDSTVLMGRKTYESIGKALPNRTNVVLTGNTSFSPEGVIVLHSFEEALAFCQKQENVFIIGGGEIYKLFLPYTDKLYITLVDRVINGDTDFPDYTSDFELKQSKPCENPCADGTTFTFTIWDRK